MLKRKRTARGTGARKHRSGSRRSAGTKPAPVRRRFVISSARRGTSKLLKTRPHATGAIIAAVKSPSKTPQNGHPNAAGSAPIQSTVDLTETVRTLLHLAQEHGYITYDDVNDVLPDNLSPEDLDALLTKLRSLDVEIVMDQAEADRVIARANLDRALRGESFAESAYSGEPVSPRRFFEVTHDPIRDMSGAVVGVAVQARDLTERQELETALQESVGRYRRLFETMREGYAYCRMLFDEKGRPRDWVYVAVNPAFERLTGLRDVVGKRMMEILPRTRDENPELFEIYGRVVGSGRREEFEIDHKPLAMRLRISAFRPEPEHFVAVLVDAKNQVRRVCTVHIGTLTMSIVCPRDVFREAVKEGAAGVIVAHNHPSGDPTPSPEDVDITQKLVEAGKLLAIPLLDHVVIGDRAFVSLRERGIIHD